MTYVVPHFEKDLTVAALLEECNKVRANKDTLRRNLTDPFANYGKNTNYTQGFSDIKFLLDKPHGKIKGKKMKEPFSMMPKYIQIQAALYLGCRRISCFSYSKPSLFGNTTELDQDFLTFYKPVVVNKLQK